MTTSYFRALVLFFTFLLFFSHSSHAQNTIISKLNSYINNELSSSRSPFSANEFLLVKKSEKGRLVDNIDFRLIRRIGEGYYIISINKDIRDSEILNSFQNIWTVNNKWKLSNALFEDIILKKKSPKQNFFLIKTINIVSLKKYLIEKNVDYEVVQQYNPTQAIVLNLLDPNQINHIINCSSVTFIDYTQQKGPEEEAFMNSHDLSSNKVNLVHSEYPHVTGEGLNVSIKEDLYDISDLDLISRANTTEYSSDTLSPHATFMATIIGGAGNTSMQFGKGAAWKCNMTSATFDNWLAEPDIYFTDNNISVQNHSYGFPIFNYYSTETQSYDVQANNLDVLHVFSSGNSGLSTPDNGAYSGIEQYANITGRMKMAKNNLVVGNVDEYGTINERSSRGPAFDGRLKPELVAYGKSGSSDAAALVSGITTLIQDFYQTQNGNLPSLALLKSVLIAGANDLGSAGIDFIHGYGMVNAYNSFKIVDNNTIYEGNVDLSNTQTLNIDVPANTDELVIALSWNDPAANVEDNIALSNDLDLVLKNLNTNEEILPWVLNSNANITSLQELPTRKEDHLNTVEYLTIKNPEAGTYELAISASSLVSVNQDFAIAYRMVPKNYFKWTYPSATDHLEADEPAIFRWDTNLELENVSIEINYNGGEWETIETDTTLSLGYYAWFSDEVSGIAQLRINDDGTYYLSDKFTINDPMKLKIGANCTSDFNVFWDEVPNAASYALSKIVDGFLEPFLTTTKSSIVFNKTENPDLIYTVTPVFSDNTMGRRSLATNYTLQGVSCYYTSFFASVDDDISSIILKLNLNSIDGLKDIYFEKESENGNYEVIHQADLANITNEEDGLFYQFDDSNPNIGVNYYRVRVQTESGDEELTEESEVYYAAPSTLVVYPNPVQNGGTINILSDGGEGAVFQLYTTQGKLIFTTDLPTSIEELPLPILTKGIYIYRNYKNDKQVSVGKLMIY